MLPELLDQIPPAQEIGSVTADGAYDTCKCHNAIADRGASAAIPPRKNAKSWKPDTAGAIARNDAVRVGNTLDGHSGENGADTTAEVASRRRCTA